MDERTLYLTWGRRIARLRTACDLKQADLAERVGTSQQVISNIETGARRPSDSIRPAIAEALGTTVADLFSYEPDEETVA